MTSASTPTDSTMVAPSRRRWWLGVIAVLIIGYAVWHFPTWLATAQTGTAYGARVACSCHFVQGRTLESCATDFEPGMELVSVARVEGERAVRASVPLLASRTAHYDGISCLLDAD